MRIQGMVVVLLLMLCILNANLIYAEDDIKAPDLNDLSTVLTDNAAMENESVTSGRQALDSEPEIQWILGKVIALDVNAKSLSIRYSDYDTDKEKDILINVDNNTSYDNVKSLDEIKAQDSISVDYIVSAEGKNIARNISLEKIEAQEIPQEESSRE